MKNRLQSWIPHTYTYTQKPFNFCRLRFFICSRKTKRTGSYKRKAALPHSLLLSWENTLSVLDPFPTLGHSSTKTNVERSPLRWLPPRQCFPAFPTLPRSSYRARSFAEVASPPSKAYRAPALPQSGLTCRSWDLSRVNERGK